MFFTNSSLEMVYFEAIANALDAGANNIKITIKMENASIASSLIITIEDNGVGFTDERYQKFIKLFDVEEDSHKGLGRLVYRFYFNDVKIISHFDKNKKREFTFEENMTENKIENVQNTHSGTKLILRNYTLQKLGKNNYISAKYLKNRILEEFYSIFFKKKSNMQPITIHIESGDGLSKDVQTINQDDILDLKKVELDEHVDLINKLYLHYYIQEIDKSEKSLISAISIDNRTFQYEVIADENIPNGYQMVFLLFSDYFNGKVDFTRQNINIPRDEEKRIKSLFREKVASLIEEEAPEVKEKKNRIKNNLVDKFPHLSHYFNGDIEIGYSSRDEVLKNAQKKFFKDQKELLEASDLDDEQYEKSLAISSMALTEYILFRQLTIEQLKKTTSKDSEANIHNILATKNTIFNGSNIQEDIYKNRSWVLDDKYMTYKTILSDKQMDQVVSHITEGEVEKDGGKPDIALIFSNSPDENSPFDVVIVELKKRGIKLEDNMTAVTQLESRARKLMKYYNNQIQRIWFYGIIEFNEEVELALAGEFTELYSSGKMYYNEKEIAISLKPKKTLPIGIFMWDLDAVIKDAENRNATFLNMIKSKFKVDSKAVVE